MAFSRNDIGWKRLTGTFVFGMVLNLYTAFVAQSFWNWFATRALNVPRLSFWVCLGCLMLVQLLKSNGAEDLEEKQRFNTIVAILDSCVPDDRRELVTARLSEQVEQTKVDILVTAVSKGFGQLVGNTITLVIGWKDHGVAYRGPS